MAEVLGIGTCFNDYIPHVCFRHAIKALLDLPDDRQVHAGITMGYPGIHIRTNSTHTIDWSSVSQLKFTSQYLEWKNIKKYQAFWHEVIIITIPKISSVHHKHDKTCDMRIYGIGSNDEV